MACQVGFKSVRCHLRVAQKHLSSLASVVRVVVAASPSKDCLRVVASEQEAEVEGSRCIIEAAPRWHECCVKSQMLCSAGVNHLLLPHVCFAVCNSMSFGGLTRLLRVLSRIHGPYKTLQPETCCLQGERHAASGAEGAVASICTGRRRTSQSVQLHRQYAHSAGLSRRRAEGDIVKLSGIGPFLFRQPRHVVQQHTRAGRLVCPIIRDHNTHFWLYSFELVVM
jgi:hypothetical protein